MYRYIYTRVLAKLIEPDKSANQFDPIFSLWVENRRNDSHTRQMNSFIHINSFAHLENLCLQ